MNTRKHQPTRRIKRLTRVTLLGSALVTPAVLMGINPTITAVMAADNGNQNGHEGHDHADSSDGHGDTVTRWTCPMHPQIVEEEPGSCPICGMDLVEKEMSARQAEQAAEGEQRDDGEQESRDEGEDDDHAGHDHADHAENGGDSVTRWTCPMHPQIVEEEPGSCPICGMDLVEKEYPAEEVEEDGQGGGGDQPDRYPSVSVDPLTVQHMNVVVTEAAERQLAGEIRTVGTVGYDEDRLAHVHPRAEGWVERLHVGSIGANVEKGDVLLEVYSPDIVSAQQDYLVALRRGMDDLIESTRARLELLNVPESTIERIRQDRKVQRRIPLRAPQDGYVAELDLREGMYIRPDMELYTIARRDRVWVNVDVLERRMQAVGEGQTARMRVDGIPGREFEGEVDFVYPELDPQSRTLRVRLAFDNEDGLLRPNQFAEVTLSPANAPEVLAVPSTAIIPAPGGARVVVRTGEGRFRPVAVETGVEAGGYTEIVSGLEAGDQVVASGQFLIDSESNVQAAFSRLSGSSGNDKSSDDSGDDEHSGHEH
ncbi:MAG: efflux RND transporter periplasmic adaptor subunit [Guyparkeria sp.]